MMMLLVLMARWIYVRRGDKDRDAKGRHRPVLVLTFARRWFVDVCNFPKNSIFASDETII